MFIKISSGICVIIDIHKFDDGHVRFGSEISVKFIDKAFQQLGFNVKTYTDLNSIQIFNVINELIESEECKNHDAFVLYIHTHGIGESVIASDRSRIKINDIIKLFTDENCPILINKPKILIFDCCRPDDLDDEFYDAPLIPGPTPYSDVTVCYSTLLGKNFNQIKLLY